MKFIISCLGLLFLSIPTISAPVPSCVEKPDPIGKSIMGLLAI